jgi:hypothetical protein
MTIAATNVEPRIAPKIESIDLSLGDVFKDFYSVPDFQREYVWEEDDVEKLLTDVQDEFYDEDGRLAGQDEYFIGSIVACRESSGTFQLIDGQQRMTTIFLVVCAIRDRLLKLQQQPSQALQNFIRAVSMDSLTGKDVARYRLALQYEDSRGVLETIADGQQSIDQIELSTSSIRHIVEAYNAATGFLESNFGSSPDALRQFLGAFMSRVKLIRIVTPNLAHALKVFETINDRGIGLNAMDLLKNLLFMRTRQADYGRLKNGWKDLISALDRKEKPLRFLRYYIMSHHEVDAHKGLREDEIYSWLVDNSKDVGLEVEPLTFLDRLVASARAYAQFLDGRDVQGNVVAALQNISTLAGRALRQHLIILLAAQHLKQSEFSALCRHLENLFFCYLITKEQGKTYERNFAKWSKDLREVHDPSTLDVFFQKNIRPELVDREKAFDLALRHLSQGQIQQYRLRYLLAKLTQHIDQLAWHNPAHASLAQYLSTSAVELEHILPSKPKPENRAAFDKPDDYGQYVGRLGNLALLEKTINASINNGIFSSKKAAYTQSSFLLTKAIAEKPNVGSNTQLNRAVAELEPFATWFTSDIERRQGIF